MQRDSKLSYADAAKEHCGRTRNAVWLQLRDNEMDSLERLKAHFLVGRLQEGEFFVYWGRFKRWGLREWEIRGALRVSQLSRDVFLLDFEDRKEAERVLQRGRREFEGRLFALEKWGLKVGCLKASKVMKDCWVRVVGLPLLQLEVLVFYL